MVTIVSEVDMRGPELSMDERQKLDEFWIAASTFYNSQVLVPIFTADEKAALEAAVKRSKEIHRGVVFDGYDPKTGIGVRFIVPQDVMIAATQYTWDITWANTDAYRQWLADNVPDNDTFDNASQIKTVDSGQDHWGVLLLGIANRAVSPKTTRLVYMLNSIPHSPQYIENHMTIPEMAIYKLPNPIWIDRDIPFKFGLWPVSTGNDAPIPLGFTIASATRMKDTSPNVPTTA